MEFPYSRYVANNIIITKLAGPKVSKIALYKDINKTNEQYGYVRMYEYPALHQ